jgi:hypothetical protein
MSNLSKFDEAMNNISFENDFGESPLFIGRVTKDQAVIGIASAIVAFGSFAIAGPGLAFVVLAAAVNDILACDDKPSRKKAPRTVDTTAEEIYDDDYDEVEEDYEEPARPPRREARTPKRESSTQQRKQRPSRPIEEPDDIESDDYEEVAPQPRASRRDRREPPRENTGAIPQLPQVTGRAKRELIDRLKDECPALLRLIKDFQPIRMVGKQRTGKTTAVKKLALLRMILLPNHRVIASTPHNEAGNSYPDVFDVVGLRPDGSRDYVAIRREWNDLADRIEASRVNSITTVWDEFEVMDIALAKAIAGGKPDAEAIKTAQEEISLNLTSSLRESAKFGEGLIFVVHGETARFLPGSKGLVTVFLDGTVRFETIGKSVEDEDGLAQVRPTGKFRITWLDGSEDSGQIPDWLTEGYLLELLGNPKQPETKYTSKWVDDEAQKREAKRLKVEEKKRRIDEEAIASPDPTPELRISDSLGEPLKSIWLMAKERADWITVRDIQRKDFAVLKGKGSEQIHQYLGLLADTGYGEIDEEGKAHSSVRFKAH